MAKFLRFKYPKLFSLIIIYAITIVLSGCYWTQASASPNLHDNLWVIFLCGWFYAYAFSAAPATAGLLILAKNHTLITASLVAGLGALFSDMLIFLFVKQTFMAEITLLRAEPVVITITNNLTLILGKWVKYFLPILASLLIASPLPTEAGVVILASFRDLPFRKFIFVAYALHTLGILTILYLGQQI